MPFLIFIKTEERFKERAKNDCPDFYETCTKKLHLGWSTGSRASGLWNTEQNEWAVHNLYINDGLVWSALQQYVTYVSMSIPGGQVERCAAFAVHLRHWGLGCQQCQNHIPETQIQQSNITIQQKEMRQRLISTFKDSCGSNVLKMTNLLIKTLRWRPTSTFKHPCGPDVLEMTDVLFMTMRQCLTSIITYTHVDLLSWAWLTF